MPFTAFQSKAFLKTYQTLLASLVFCGFLLTCRVLFMRELNFVFLAWNLFLALLPFVFSLRLKQQRPAGLNVLKGALCLLFLPNAPYIITDLFHITHAGAGLLWFDTLLIASFAWAGMLCYYHTLAHIERFMNSLWEARLVWVAISLLNFISAFGIYLGRYLRFNSWDIASQPFHLFYRITHILVHPAQHLEAWGVTFFYGLFLFMGYRTIKPLRQEAIPGKATS